MRSGFAGLIGATALSVGLALRRAGAMPAGDGTIADTSLSRASLAVSQGVDERWPFTNGRVLA
ncbi:MAG: hypothetical protein AB7Q29_16935 [Vicinamibacterales bacterium]